MNVAIPPRSRNHRLPAACDAPTTSAASSLLRPFAISRQNNRSTSRRNDGFPGDFIGALPVNSVIHPAGLPIATPLDQVLQRPIESAHALIDWCATQRTLTSYIDPGAPWQNPFVESFHSRVRDELLNLELFSCLAEAQVMIEDWRQDFNQHRPHSSLGRKAPNAFAAAWTAPTPAGAGA